MFYRLGFSLVASVSVSALMSGEAIAQSEEGEIIVTAQRRSENLRDVPISITALNSDALQRSGVSSTLDLPRLAPGLELPLNGGFTQPSIRGVSSGGSDVGDSSNVAVYVDGVYRPAQSAQLMDLPDVEQVEVLKGPQGTLYGQGAEGGAIVITTRAPSFTTEGKISTSYGNHGSLILQGVVSAPFTDKLAFSLSGVYEDRDGLRYNVATHENDSGLRARMVRGKLLFQPSDSASFTLTGFFSRRKDSSPYGGKAVDGRSVGYFIYPSAPQPESTREIALDTPTLVDIKNYGFSLRSEVDIDAGTITSITSFTKNQGRLTVDVDYSPANIASIYAIPLSPDQEFITQDLSFVSTGWGSISLTAGVFLMATNEGYRPQSFTIGDGALNSAPGTGTTIQQFQHIKRFILAGFAELEYAVTGEFTVSAGGRYSYERQRGYADLFGSAPNEIPSPFNPAVFKKFTPRITARLALSPRSNIYATFGQGFKSGILSTSALTSAPARPETLTAYEIGYKGVLFDKLSLNVAGFYYDWKDLQVQRYVPPQSIYENAASARSKGVDVDVSFRVTPELTLTAGGVYLDAKYRRYPLAGTFMPNASGGNDNATIIASGLRTIRAPKFTATFGATYDVDTRAGKLGLSGSLYHHSGSRLELTGRIRQPKHDIVDAQISFSPLVADYLKVSLWGRNLTNKAYLQSLLQTNFADGISYAPPRTYGVRAEFTF